MKPDVPFAILALCALAIPVSAQNETVRIFGDGSLPAFLKQFDVKGNPDGSPDGILDEEERQAMREALAKRRLEQRMKWDTDGDGVLSPEEISAAREETRQRIEERRVEHFLKVAGEDEMLSLEEFLTLPPFIGRDPSVPTSIFLMMDTNKDGLVSVEEFTARLRPRSPQLPPFREMDINPADGRVSLEEFIAATTKERISESSAREMFARLDRNQDGFIAPEEMPNQPPPPPAPPPVLPEFRVADVSGDGKLSPYEFVHAAMKVGIPELTARAMFKSLDTDANHWLSPAEYAAAL
jgi:Ca2+-binding EF-hand superfamily protein